LLADAGRKKLTALVLGSDQERALRKAAADAVQDTAAEMNLSAEQARQLAMVIKKAFRKPVQDAPLARDLGKRDRRSSVWAHQARKPHTDSHFMSEVLGPGLTRSQRPGAGRSRRG